MMITPPCQTLIRMAFIGILLFAGACQANSPTLPAPTPASETTISVTTPQTLPQTPGATQPAELPTLAQVELPVQLLPITGPLQAPLAELSGLSWFGDQLILLPQYPERFIQPDAAESFGAVFAISKSEIRAYLSGQTTVPFNPRPIPLFAPDLKQKIGGYEGFESLVIDGKHIYLTIETHQLGGMLALLIGGEIEPDLSRITLDASHLGEISAQASIANFSDEAISLINGQLVTFYEGNGARVTPTPVAHVFDLKLNSLGVIFAPSLEYRITDATPADVNGRFWVMNYFFPGDTKIAPANDPLFQQYGIPPSHQQSKAVERLVQMQWNEKTITLVPRPPLYLQLMPDGTARNWEGLAQLDDLGFLVVTDSYPSTLFGFVAQP